MNNNLLNHPALQNISEEKKIILMEFLNEADGLPPEKAMPLLMKTNAKLKALGLTFSKEESELISESLMQNLSAVDRMKLDTLRKMLPK